MRQVDEAELVWALKYALSRISASMRNELASRTTDVRRGAEQRLAIELARGALGKFEVLNAAAIPAGTNLYERAAFREPGDRGGGTAPTIEANVDSSARSQTGR